MLMSGDVRNRYDLSRRHADEQRKGLRLKLRIEAPELAAVPWEFLYDERPPGEYVCLSQVTPFVRYLELPQPTPPLKVQKRLRRGHRVLALLLRGRGGRAAGGRGRRRGAHPAGQAGDPFWAAALGGDKWWPLLVAYFVAFNVAEVVNVRMRGAALDREAFKGTIGVSFPACVGPPVVAMIATRYLLVRTGYAGALPFIVLMVLLTVPLCALASRVIVARALDKSLLNG